MKSTSDVVASVTTDDRCSACGAKLTNAETARLNHQAEAFRLKRERDEALARADKAEAQFRERVKPLVGAVPFPGLRSVGANAMAFHA